MKGGDCLNESILTSVKAILGLEEDYTPFDNELIIHINSFFEVLHQLGAGRSGFEIRDKTATWADFIGDGKWVPCIKTWMALRVRQVWDSVESNSLMSMLDEKIDEFTQRIIISLEYDK